jgi:hypothetical protein
MFYILLVVAAVIVTALLSKQSPGTMRTTGLVALGVAVVSVVTAELSGNLLLFYLAGLLGAFAVALLLIWGVRFLTE